MRTFLSGLFLIITSLTSIAQNDTEAIKILDKFSALALGAPSVSMKFTMETIDQVEGTNTSSTGSIILSKDSYRLDMTDNIIWFNGETSWSYLPAEKEVTVAKPDKKDNSFMSRPSAVFSVYKKGYNVRLLEEKSSSYLIDLYPEDINSDHIRIRLNIGKPSLDLKSLEYKYKNGVTAILTVKEYDLKQKPDNYEFTFPSDKYKGVEIIDMR
ncbi:MAG: outer membrane lipoprotein carrier protein LolA [Bacteroidia bacterium]|jgi:outer membrane lipoprotein-sorting protein|nr:outer membrane lipoprotein carrier protein LolA [Bacteroidia bacterium]